MSAIRFTSIENVLNRLPIEIKRPSERVSEFFRENVFDHEAMKKHLPEDAYFAVMNAIGSGQKIDRAIADQVALSMKAWAIGKGATHFTHWFQPLTGATAEKHDTFFVPGINGDGKGMESFTGSALVQQEPDASSFPSGGLRATFEARGYTAWDPSSPAFIMEIGQGKTLCIPTIFVSYNGEALDFKAPLLKSINELEQAAVAVCQFFDKNVKHVTPTLGWEQEYFLIDAALFFARPDLVLTGRTVFGHSPAKGQQLEDHYFGSIPERAYRFMLDLETECWKLGIPVRTRHNEVAPAQYECAPTFEDVNLAVDHNQLLMDLMDRIGRKHKLRVLFHEKPFDGINGSGKHNNWSMMTDNGKNLLSPGRTPKTNLQFLTFFLNVIKAVHDHDDLIRSSIAGAGNDFRLGANEAPPAIISIFIGDQLMEVMDEIESRVHRGELDEQDRMELKLNIHNKIPDVLLDNTDRNRTSPFAFTGTKFEFRAIGSSANCSGPMTVLNTIMASQLRLFKKAVDKRVKNGETRDEAILKELRSIIKNCKRILFEGDNYSTEWHKEAARRGLSNIKDTPRALDAMVSKKSLELFRETGVLNERELHARHDILLHNYALKLQIEGRVIGDLAINHILPAAVRYQNELLQNIQGLKAIKAKASDMKAQLTLVKQISEHIQGIKTNVDKMTEARRKSNKIDDPRLKAVAYCDNVKPYFEIIREHVDKLEVIVDDRLWPLPKYRELLFVR